MVHSIFSRFILYLFHFFLFSPFSLFPLAFLPFFPFFVIPLTSYLLPYLLFYLLFSLTYLLLYLLFCPISVLNLIAYFLITVIEHRQRLGIRLRISKRAGSGRGRQAAVRVVMEMAVDSALCPMISVILSLVITALFVDRKNKICYRFLCV